MSEISEATKARAQEIATRVAERRQKEAALKAEEDAAKQADLAYAQALIDDLKEQGHDKETIAETLRKMGIDYGIVEFLMAERLEYPHHQLTGIGGPMGQEIAQRQPNQIIPTPEAPPANMAGELTEEAPPPSEPDAEPAEDA